MTSPKPSRRKKADFAPNAETFHLLFANHPIPMWVYDLKTLAFLDVNDTALEKYGYTRDEFLALTIKDIRPEGDVARLINSLEQKHTDLHHSGEWRHRFKNGQIIDVEITTHTLEFEGHKATLVMAQDITERKQAEEKLKESLSLLRLTEEAAKLGGWSVDLETNRITWSDEVAAIHETPAGFSPLVDEGIGFYAPEWRERITKVYSDCAQQGISYNEELEIITANGKRVWVQTMGEAFRDNKGKIIKVRGAFQDISERKQAEQKLAQYSEHLEEMVEARTMELRETQEKLIRNEKLAVLGQLAGGVGHELRNPLAVINNALYYLKLVGTSNDEKLKEYLGIIQTEAHTAERIITDLLDFARIKSVDVEAVSAFKLAARVLERYPAPKAVNVRLEIPEDLPMLYADPRQMEQVLGNLVINACQAMSLGGAPASGELTITAHQKQGMIAIAVKDTGMGIPPENMKKLFEPLFTTKAKGIGLGLAVSQKLAEANGGRIEVQSEPGKGSTFTLVLPVHGGEP